MKRVRAYIDGFNLYHGIKEHTKARAFRWVDLRALAEHFLAAGETLDEVLYYTTIPPWHPGKARRHQLYLDALGVHGVSVRLGRFQPELKTCYGTCGEIFTAYTEKLTDVNLATELLADAFLDKFDVAILVSGDADQVPTLETVRRVAPRKQIRVVFPPRRGRADLQRVAHDCPGEIGYRTLKANQLPDRIELPGRTIDRPEGW